MTKFAVSIDVNEASITNLQKKIKHNHKMRKLLLLSMLAFLPAVGMNAQTNAMSADDVEFDAADESAEMQLNLTVDEASRYFATEFTIMMPEGFTIESVEEDGELFWSCSVNTNRQRGTEAALKYFPDGNYYNVITSSVQAYKINQKSGYYLTATILASEDVASGTYPVTVKNIAMADGVVEVDMPDFTFNIIYTKPAKTYDLTVTDAQMATMYLDYAVSVPETVLGVYYVSSKTGNTLNMAELTEIPANTGVIVMANPGTYTFTETTNSVADVDNNYLKGVNEATAVSELGSTIYTLGRGKNAGLLGFHKYTGSTLAAHKAYMTDETGNVNAFNLAFPDGTTFINRLSIDSKTQEIYDLQGRRVEHPTSGVYIINGVKTVVK